MARNNLLHRAGDANHAGEITIDEVLTPSRDTMQGRNKGRVSGAPARRRRPAWSPDLPMTLIVHLAAPLEDVWADGATILLSEETLRWSKSPECREIAKQRLKGMKSSVAILEGLVRGK